MVGRNHCIKIKNGDRYVNYWILSCDFCKTEIEEAWPHYYLNDLCYCPDCAFRKSLISEKVYISCCGVHLDNLHAGINPENGEIEITNKRFSWEKIDKDYRKTKDYKDWRTSVFERDAYTCLHCGNVGGCLEAHHIYSFKDYKSLRYEITNGITLCKKCHLAAHSKAVKK